MLLEIDRDKTLYELLDVESLLLEDQLVETTVTETEYNTGTTGVNITKIIEYAFTPNLFRKARLIEITSVSDTLEYIRLTNYIKYPLLALKKRKPKYFKVVKNPLSV